MLKLKSSWNKTPTNTQLPYREDRRHMSRNTCPDCEQQHCTQFIDLFAICSSPCTSSRSPNWWEVSWPQVPIPSWMSKSNRVAGHLHHVPRHVRAVARQTVGKRHGHRSPFPAGYRTRTVQQLRSETERRHASSHWQELEEVYGHERDRQENPTMAKCN